MNGLGRRVAVDDRDRVFAMAPVVTLLAEPRPALKSWRINGRSIDQGNTSSCVGHAWRNFLRCAPLQSERGPSPWDIYRRAVALDPWADNDHEAQYPDGDRRMVSGTSVRAGAKALQERNHIKTYLWAWDVETIVDWLLSKGPVVVGTNWYDSMDRPDEDGLVKVKGQMVGGHAYLARGANVNTEKIMFENSWGDDWALSGRFYISFTDFARLMREEGEACTAVEEWVKPA